MLIINILSSLQNMHTYTNIYAFWECSTIVSIMLFAVLQVSGRS